MIVRQMLGWAISLYILGISTVLPADAALKGFSSSDISLGKTALQSIKQNKATSLYAMTSKIADKDIQNFLKWMEYRSPHSTASFYELKRFVETNPTIPNRDLIILNMEEAALRDLTDGDLQSYFKTYPPRNNAAKLKQIGFLFAHGQKETAISKLKSMWHEATFTREQFADIMNGYGNFLTAADHQKRMDFLLWEDHLVNADLLLPYLSGEQKSIAVARIALRNLKPNALTLMKALSPKAQQSAGVIYHKIYYLRKVDRLDEAIKALSQVSDYAARQYPHKWWQHRNALSRLTFRDHGAALAYKIVSAHHLNPKKSAADYVEAEWYAGWLSLKYLHNANKAAGHFSNAGSISTMPVSIARAAYWNGMAYKALGQAEKSRSSFQKAAVYPYTYYGLLAGEALGVKTTSLPLPPVPTELEKKEFWQNPTVRMIYIATALDANAEANILLSQLAWTTPKSARHVLIGNLAKEIGKEDMLVRLGKIALSKGVFIKDMAYPVLPYFKGQQGGLEAPLLLALSKQESEFNAGAVSHVGARGLMQLMPATAREVSGKLGLPYQEAKLINDPAYNVRLGSYYIGQQVDNFSGSYIMALAAYNAGAGRVRQWIDSYKDPRDPGIDAVDWVEKIPFTETRNYVQRIVEGTHVYRARLAGNDIMHFNAGQTLKRLNSY